MQYEEEWKVYNDYFNTLDFAEQKGMQMGMQKGLAKRHTRKVYEKQPVN